MDVLETTRMSTRGQVIIPKAVREQSKSKENDLFAVSLLDENTIVLKRMNTSQLLKDFRKMRAKVNKEFSMTEINAEVKAARRDRR